MSHRRLPLADSDLKLIADVQLLLSDPKRHCQHTLARDKWGTPTGPLEEDAVQWCVMGAFVKALGKFPMRDEFDHFSRLLGYDKGDKVMELNDSDGGYQHVTVMLHEAEKRIKCTLRTRLEKSEPSSTSATATRR